MKGLSSLARHAQRLMVAHPEWAQDAREGAAVSNTVIGSVMSITTGSPRWATEQAVREALVALPGEGKKR